MDDGGVHHVRVLMGGPVYDAQNEPVSVRRGLADLRGERRT